MPIKDAVATVLSRNAFYRDGYRLLLRVAIIQGIIVIALLVTIVGMILSIEDKRIYFATTSDGRLIELVPLDQPYRTNAEVIAWAASTAQNTMRFGYSDYRERLKDAAGNFTPAGWESFL